MIRLGFGTLQGRHLPDTFQMHGANLDDVSGLLGFQDTITSASCHACHVEQFGSVDEMIVWNY